MTKNAVKHLWPLIATSIVAGTILTILSPYGTYQMSLVYRAAFWIGLCIVGGLGTGIVDAIIRKFSRGLPAWQRVLLQSLGATVGVWLCFLGLTIYLQGSPDRDFYYITPFYIWVIGLTICSAGELMRQRNEAGNVPANPDQRAAILERLKPALRNSEVYALSAEDHYVRVHTSLGDDLILIRLADAIKEAAPLPGLQTHRSWWIAEAGVREVSKSDGKLTVFLRNDVIAPVSRGRSKDLRAAAWI